MSDAVRVGGTSAEVIRDLFTMHFYPRSDKLSVLDLTYGLGVWWRWDWSGRVELTRNSLHGEGELHLDYTKAVPLARRSFDVVCFDPPFAAMGPSKKMPGYRERYGGTRGPGLKSVMDVRRGLIAGIKNATLLARMGVIVKTQNVIESGENWDNVHLAEDTLGGVGWRTEDWAYMVPEGGRPQPEGRRELHLRNRPSVFIVARP